MNPRSTCDLRSQMLSAFLLRTATSMLYCLFVSLGAPAPLSPPPTSWGPVYDVTSVPILQTASCLLLPPVLEVHVYGSLSLPLSRGPLPGEAWAQAG